MIGALIALVIFVTTLQMTVNGSDSTYTIDVGEIQNALPRWGTLHFPGYPFYSLTGAIFVSFLQFFNIEPALASSILSALWAASAIALLIALDMTLEVPGPIAIITALLFAVSTSFWVDASIAEVHTLTVALLLASILFAIRFGRSGKRSDLYWLVLFSSQMIYHQRAMIFAVPGLLILTLRHHKILLKSLPVAALIAVVGAAVYLYLPISDWLGSEWTFNQPGTWRGFWGLVLDTKSERIISIPDSGTVWLERVKIVASVISAEWPLWLVLIGLLGILFIGIRGQKIEVVALTLIWMPYVLVSLLIWVGRVADALLAVTLPVIVMAAVGLAILTSVAYRWRRWVGTLLTIVWLILTMFLFWDHRPTVLAITRDAGAEEIISLAESFNPPLDGKPTTLMALWGKDYWALSYAQEYLDELPQLNIVDHNANLRAILDSEEHLVTLSDTFYLRPLSWWDDEFGRVYLASNSADLIEIDTMPPVDPDLVDSNQDFDIQNGISIRRTELERVSPNLLALTIYWEVIEKPKEDYSVAVHLVSLDPPQSQEDILTQADSVNPVAGWYPTSRWQPGEVIRDQYWVPITDGVVPEAIRIGMYRTDDDGSFVNSDWLSLSIQE